MKIEIGEIMTYSYLKHVEGCRIVQTNWKTSGKWSLTEYDKEQAKKLFEKVRLSPSFEKIFKNNSFEQLIKQAEIDVLGINPIEHSIFGIDVAFHTSGLNYGTPEETAFIVLKKIFRTIFIMQCYFKEFDKFNSYFVTPKANPGYKTLIEKLIIDAKEIINDDSISVQFISNEDFYLNMIDPLKYDLSDENDTMELFSRVVKLLQLDCRPSNTGSLENGRVVKTSFVKSSKSSGVAKRMEEGMKIGQYVQYNMRKLFEEKLISTEELRNLQDKDYSKRIFNLNFEVLRQANKSTLDAGGRNRYYSNELFFGNYHLTSQWFEEHWNSFKSWMGKMKMKQLH